MNPKRLHLRSLTSALSAAVLLTSAAGLHSQDKPAPAAPPSTPPAAAPAAPAPGSDIKAASLRRFTTRDGKTFYATVTAKTGTSVTFKLQNGKTVTQSLRSLSEPDVLYIQKWTKFKADLLANAEFASLKVQELLELRGYQSFEFDIRGNHIFVEGEMGGKPVNMMIDTGAASSVIHDKFAKEVGLDIGPYDQKIYGVAGSQPAAVTKLTTLKLGEAAISGRRILATDLAYNTKDAEGNPRPPMQDLIFGADFLRELDACISYSEGRMFLKTDNIGKAAKPSGEDATLKAEVRRWTAGDGSNKTFSAALVDKTDTEATFEMASKQRITYPIDKLSEPDREMIAKWSKLRNKLAQDPEWRTMTVKELLELRAYQSFQYRLEDNHILVDGTVKGPSGETKTRFLIDTGAYHCCMDYKFATEKAKLETGKLGETMISGIGGDAPAAHTKIEEIKLGDSVLKTRQAVSAEIHKGQLGQQGNHDALFGANFLRELDAVISYKENRMFLRPDNSDKASTASADAPKNDGDKKEEDK